MWRPGECWLRLLGRLREERQEGKHLNVEDVSGVERLVKDVCFKDLLKAGDGTEEGGMKGVQVKDACLEDSFVWRSFRLGMSERRTPS